MGKPLKKFKKKEPRSLLEADEANKLIDAIEASKKGTIVPQGTGTVQFSDDGFTIDLSQLLSQLQTKSSSADSTASGNGASTSDQPSTFGGGSSDSSDLAARVSKLENRMSAASISAVCLSGGQIQVTLNL